MEVQGSFQPRSTHGLNPASELPSSNRLSSRVTGSFSYCRLNIPRIPPLSARDENEIPSPLLQHALDAEREWEAVEVQRRRIIIQALAFSPSLQECLTASVLSEFLPPLDLPPFIPYLVIPSTNLFFLDLLPIY
jgi:hypothetical protein